MDYPKTVDYILGINLMKCQQTKTAVLTFLFVKIGVIMQSYLSRMSEIRIHKKVCCSKLLSETVTQ